MVLNKRHQQQPKAAAAAVYSAIADFRAKSLVAATLLLLLVLTALDTIVRYHNSRYSAAYSVAEPEPLILRRNNGESGERTATRGGGGGGGAGLMIRGTALQGSLVQKFRNHLDCFSESGRWVYNATPRALPWNFAGDPYASACDGKHSTVAGNAVGEWADILASHPDYGNWTIRETLKWVWKTNSSCPLQPLNRAEFCRLLGSLGGNVLVAGDSLNHLLQWSLLNNLLLNKNDPELSPESRDSRTSQGFRLCHQILGSKRFFRVGFVRNDRLSTIPENQILNDTYRNFLEWPWLHLIPLWNIKLLILNKGAHFEPDQIFETSLRETLNKLRSLHPDLLVIFRNTPPGHENCTQYSGPIRGRQQIRDDKFHWTQFARQNLIARAVVEDAGYVYVDADTMLHSRPDGHIDGHDCLHYCVPGPLDSLVQLIFNVLSLLLLRQ